MNNANNWGIYDSRIYTLILNIYCQQLGVYVSGRVSVPPSGAGLGNVHFVKYIFVSDIYYQQFGDICQLDEYLAIGFILPAIGDLC